MTIVIPYKDDILSEWELKFALRSIDKYLTGFTNLVIIGTPPEWYTGEFTPFKETRNRKQFNIYSKLLAACEMSVVTDSFVMWNDDHYLLKSLDVCDILVWYDGYLRETINKNHGARYKETIANTLQIIPGTLNYDIHVPCIYHKELFKLLFSKRSDEVCIKSNYFDYATFDHELRYSDKTKQIYVVCNRNDLRVAEMKDFKINQLLSKEAIKELIKERLFFSTSTNGMKKPMIELMNELYPNPSQWER